MKSELLLYGYGIVCLGMLVFNVIYNIGLKQNGRRMEKRVRKMGNRIDAQMERIHTGGRIAPGHIRYLRRSLSHVNNLVAFERAIREYPAAADEAYGSYRSQIHPAILQLAVIALRQHAQSIFFAVQHHHARGGTQAAEKKTDADGRYAGDTGGIYEKRRSLLPGERPPGAV